MFCRFCGAENEEGAYRCTSCGQVIQVSQVPLGVVQQPVRQQPVINPNFAGQSYGPPVQVPNYLAFGILTTIFCCLPFGIPAIVFASQANSKALLGDFEGAMVASNNARTWCIASLVTGVVVGLVYFLLVGASLA